MPIVSRRRREPRLKLLVRRGRLPIPNEVRISGRPEDMLRFDLDNERVTILNYRTRIRQADAMGEFAPGEVLRKIIAQEQKHLTDLAEALDIDNPKLEE
ncbi:MAG: ferritin-like domain-containing protein [Opitutaceae bacterium]|nr:ferritin-like domain-containing protein [Opitutaceae bacterium]